MRFYKGIGFKTYELADNLPIVLFDNEGTKLELFLLYELAKEINPTNPPVVNTDFSGITLAINFKKKKEIELYMKQIVDSGGTVAKGPELTS